MMNKNATVHFRIWEIGSMIGFWSWMSLLLYNVENYESAQPDVSESTTTLSKCNTSRKISKTALGVRFDKKHPTQSSATNL